MNLSEDTIKHLELRGEVITKDMEIATLKDNVKNKNFYFWMMIFFIVTTLWACHQRAQLKQGAIKHGVLQYNATNGVLQWVNQINK